MVEVRLHGELAKTFGKVFFFDVASPAEAFRALRVACKGFAQKIRELDVEHVFRVRGKNHDYVDDEVDLLLGSTKRLDIIPIVRGSSAGVRFVIGAVLVVVGYAVPGAQMLIPVGISLMVGSVVEWLTPLPKRDDPTSNDVKSWTINGPTNTVDQGQPVPIIYGEVLTGSLPISAGLSVSQATPDGSVEPEVTIGGNPNPSYYPGGPGEFTFALELSAAPFNLVAPLSYKWTYSGFGGTDSQQLVSSTTARFQLNMTHNFTASGTYAYSGTVNVEVKGKDARDPDGGIITRAASVACKVVVTIQSYISSSGDGS